MDKKSLLVIRIRGAINLPVRVKDTLHMLRIDRNNYATLIDDRPDYIGMLQKSKDYITWGESNLKTIRLILEKRGEVQGGKKLTKEHLREMGYESFEELAQALFKCEADLNKLQEVKPFFRLHPPRKGFKASVKRSYRNKGELGYRGEDINKLAERMC
jgi:large subunit ribosomal protein L30